MSHSVSYLAFGVLEHADLEVAVVQRVWSEGTA